MNQATIIPTRHKLKNIYYGIRSGKITRSYARMAAKTPEKLHVPNVVEAKATGKSPFDMNKP